MTTKEERLKVNEVLSPVNALFSHMTYDFGQPKALLDMMFYSNYGLKPISTIVEYLLIDNKMTDDSYAVLASIIESKYSYKWDKEKAVMNTSYDPIGNYKDVYTETVTSNNTATTDYTTTRADSTTDIINSTNTRTDDLTNTSNNTRTTKDTVTNDLTESKENTKNLTDTRTDNLTKASQLAVTDSGNTSSTDTTYGFNSSSAVNASGNSGNSSSKTDTTETVNNTGTQTDTKTGSENTTTTNTGTETTDTTVSDNGTLTKTGTRKDSTVANNEKDYTTSRTDNEAINANGTKNRTSSHTGNIGNIATQDLINKELKLWEWNFIESVLRDVNNIITLPFYF